MGSGPYLKFFSDNGFHRLYRLGANWGVLLPTARHLLRGQGGDYTTWRVCQLTLIFFISIRNHDMERWNPTHLSQNSEFESPFWIPNIQEFSSQRGNRSFIPTKSLAGRNVAYFVGVVQRLLTSGKVWWQPWNLWPKWERRHRLQSIDHSWLLDRHCLQHWQSRPRMPGQGGSYLQQVRHQNALS